MKRLIILRHGYTFEINEEARRVGARTDLPLVSRGRDKVKEIAGFLRQYKIDRIISSPLKRTLESANIVKQVIDFPYEIEISNNLKEIDYGPDENKSEAEVINRIGKEALGKWENDNILPNGWIADIEVIKNHWIDLANNIQNNQTILVITSAGIARFASYILPNIQSFKYNPKINPGHIAIFEYLEDWQVKAWNYSNLN